MCAAGDLGIQVSQPLVPSTSAARTIVTNSRHTCGICQQVCRLHVIILVVGLWTEHRLSKWLVIKPMIGLQMQ